MVRITVSDPDTGEVFETKDLTDDYLIICEGSAEETGVQTYANETLDDDRDDGTMPGNVATLSESVVGRKIVSAKRGAINRSPWSRALVLTLDNGAKVELADTDDCCAFTELESFLLDPKAVDHVITGVGTTEGYSVWHVYADWGDILKLQVAWSCGNPFGYGYGFDIRVRNPDGAPTKS